MPLFSVIIPTHNRNLVYQPALYSLMGQHYQGFEVIVVDDCSDEAILPENPIMFGLRTVRLEERSERAIARTVGMRESVGEWICWLDSDDAYAAHYLLTIKRAIEKCPEARCFNFGAIVHWRSRTDIRPTFKPAWLGDHHEEFKSGRIGAGSFVFHRSVLDEIEPLPQERSPVAFHRAATDVHHLYPVDGATLGNPWGDDWLFFYRITRKFRSYPLDNLLYVQYVRGSFV